MKKYIIIGVVLLILAAVWMWYRKGGKGAVQDLVQKAGDAAAATSA